MMRIDKVLPGRMVVLEDGDTLIERFQNQRWYVRLWRRRWYLLIPWTAMTMCTLPWGLAWIVAKGEAQAKMNWYYTMEEVFGKEELEEARSDDK